MLEWLVVGGAPTALLAAFRALPPGEAVEVFLRVSATTMPAENAAELARALRREDWVVQGLRKAHSRFWWRRMEAGRLLALVGDDGDRQVLQALLRDSSPAVQVVAGGALARFGGAEAAEQMLERLPSRSRFIRLQQTKTLKKQWAIVTPLLERRLAKEGDLDRLLIWIALADALGAVDLFERLRVLRTHPEPQVRFAIALALRNYFHPLAAADLARLLDDDEGRVRARAAQSLGARGAEEAVAPLTRSLDDTDWSVRFRSAVALAQLGETGREALRAARAGLDQYAADMASTVVGLSAGALNELAEG